MAGRWQAQRFWRSMEFLRLLRRLKRCSFSQTNCRPVWRGQMPGPDTHALTRPRPASAAWRVALLVVAFVFLYMLFGYFVAWQNPELRAYYGGPSWPTFLAALKGNWANSPGIFALA